MPKTKSNQIDLRNNIQADKAVIAMVLLRLVRPEGAKGKGIGPNRDDLPIFLEVAGLIAAGKEVPAGRKFQARHRVTKYHKQLTLCPYAEVIADREAPLSRMVEVYQTDGLRVVSERTLEKELQVVKLGDDYGNW